MIHMAEYEGVILDVVRKQGFQRSIVILIGKVNTGHQQYHGRCYYISYYIKTFIFKHGSFRVRSTNGLRVTPPISMKFGTLAVADNT